MSKAHFAPKGAKTLEKSQGKSKVKSSEEKAIRSGFLPGPPPLPRPQPGPIQIGPGSQPLQAFQQAGQFEFAIGTSTGNFVHFVTAVAGGGKTTDVLHTDAVTPRAWEKFTLWYVPSTGEYGIQTLNGEFLFATNGGDLASLFPFGNQEVDTIQSTAEYIIDYERFRISPYLSQGFPAGTFAIQTVRGFYLTAVAGGGQTDPPVLYTNGTTKTATQFGLLKSGDAGSGYNYGLLVAGGPATVSGGAYSGGPLPIGSWVIVSNGGDEDGSGGVPALMISDELQDANELQFTLIRQNDGTYAFQTSSGYYLTANGGGVSGDFRTDAPQVGNWQKFTLTANNDCTYYVQAYNGYYLGVTEGLMSDQTPYQLPNTTSDITQAVKWRLWVFALASST